VKHHHTHIPWVLHVEVRFTGSLTHRVFGTDRTFFLAVIIMFFRTYLD
jgi:hypothetical protein